VTEDSADDVAHSWHDDLIYGLQIAAADPDAGLWRSDLVLDIDHIVEWVCGTEGKVQFRVAPATLTFHYVTDLRLCADFGENDPPVTLNELSIDHVAKEHARPPGRSGDYFRWRIALNLPRGGEIAFGASGYSLTLRAEPVLLDDQRLPASNRPPLFQSG